MKHRIHFFTLLALLLINSNCRLASSLATKASPLGINEDNACRQTIQKLYSIETYCPDNLTALQSLFTDDFNRQSKFTLERCDEISRYEILTLVPEDDADFPENPNDPEPPGVVEYFAKINIVSKSGNALGNNPALVWLHMKVDESGQCKIDNIHGGG